MKIIGRGLTASALAPYRDKLADDVIFASGVADSSTADFNEFNREYDLLYETIRSCLSAEKRLIYLSSGGAIYGNTSMARTEEMPLFPITPYGRHKLLCEAIVRQSTLHYLIVRLPNLVGIQQNKNQLIPALIHQALQGKAILFQRARRDLLDVEDFASVLVSLLENVYNKDTIIIASGFSVSIIDIFDSIQDVLKTNAQIECVPHGDVQKFNIAKLQQIVRQSLPFYPNYFHEIIQKYALQLASVLPGEQ